MGSQRLPGKVLKPLGRATLLEYILHRLSYLEHKQVKLIVATSALEANDEIERICKSNHVICYRGDEDNVLSRYYESATQYGLNKIIRLTADNPFVDVYELDKLIDLQNITGADYINSFENLPYGVGAEIFTYEALTRDFLESSMPHHFEHVNEYILENPDKFKINIMDVEETKKYPKVRLTVDTEDDYQRACYIVSHSSNDYISTQEAISLCSHYA